MQLQPPNLCKVHSSQNEGDNKKRYAYGHLLHLAVFATHFTSVGPAYLFDKSLYTTVKYYSHYSLQDSALQESKVLTSSVKYVIPLIRVVSDLHCFIVSVFG